MLAVGKHAYKSYLDKALAKLTNQFWLVPQHHLNVNIETFGIVVNRITCQFVG